MEEKKIISIVDENGAIDEAEELLRLELSEFNKKYIIYTKNETDENNNVTIYISELYKENDNSSDVELRAIETDQEWDKLKEILKEISKSEEQISK
jgi:UPF0473 protein RBAM_024480